MLLILLSDSTSVSRLGTSRRGDMSEILFPLRLRNLSFLHSERDEMSVRPMFDRSSCSASRLNVSPPRLICSEAAEASVWSAHFGSESDSISRCFESMVMPFKESIESSGSENKGEKSDTGLPSRYSTLSEDNEERADISVILLLLRLSVF